MSVESRATTGESGSFHTYQMTPEFPKVLPKSSPRPASLSHHLFFSRHNPHPHRVRHIQGLNGSRICTVKDDWYVTTSLFPHPLLRNNMSKASGSSFGYPFASNLHGGYNKSGLHSEAWRDELKDLAAKVSLFSQIKKNKKEVQPEELDKRRTQYSAQTGRLIPPSSKSNQHRYRSEHRMYPQPLQDQELMVLELLCQILQTDSLSVVQQWLLLAGQRERDQVMGLISQALDGVNMSDQQNLQHLRHAPPGATLRAHALSLGQSWRNPHRRSLNQMQRSLSEDKPERIGDAEVLEVHPGAQSSA